MRGGHKVAYALHLRLTVKRGSVEAYISEVSTFFAWKETAFIIVLKSCKCTSPWTFSRTLKIYIYSRYYETYVEKVS